MIYTLSFANGVGVPKKVVDTGSRVCRVKFQVLDASTVFLNKNRDLLLQTSNNVIQGLQLIQNDRIYSDWIVGEMWALGSVDGAAIAVVIEYMPEGKSPEQFRGAEEGESCGESLEL